MGFNDMGARLSSVRRPLIAGSAASRHGNRLTSVQAARCHDVNRGTSRWGGRNRELDQSWWPASLDAAANPKFNTDVQN